MKKPIHIFSQGPQTSSQGVTFDFKPEVLKEIVKTYDQGTHHAPIRIGHEDNDKTPAWGWVEGLKVNRNGELIADVDFTPQMEGFIKDKLYRKVSASFYQPDCKSNPTPGKWYLRHVAMLGGQPPAVKGLKDFAYSDMSTLEGVSDFVMGNSITPEDDDDESTTEDRAVVKKARKASKKQDKEDKEEKLKEDIKKEIEEEQKEKEELKEKIEKEIEEQSAISSSQEKTSQEKTSEEGEGADSGDDSDSGANDNNNDNDDGDDGDGDDGDNKETAGVVNNAEVLDKAALVDRLAKDFGGLEFSEVLGVLAEKDKEVLLGIVKDGDLDRLNTLIGNSNSSFDSSEGFKLGAKNLWDSLKGRSYYESCKMQFGEGKISNLCKKEYLGFISTLKDVQEYAEDMSKEYPKALNQLFVEFDHEQKELDYNEKIKELEVKNQQLETEKQKEIVAKNRSRINSFVENLYEQGKLVPAIIEKETLVDYIESLEQISCEFGEFTNLTKNGTGATRLMDLLNNLPTVVEYKEVVRQDSPIPEVNMDFHEAAMKLSKEKNIEFVEALKMTMYPDK